jgi:hypothetical protein
MSPFLNIQNASTLISLARFLRREGIKDRCGFFFMAASQIFCPRQKWLSALRRFRHLKDFYRLEMASFPAFPVLPAGWRPGLAAQWLCGCLRWVEGR